MQRPFPPSRTWAPVPGKVLPQPSVKLPSELESTDLSPVVNGGAVSCRDRIMKRYLCIAFIVASVFVVKSDEPSGFVALTMITQDK